MDKQKLEQFKADCRTILQDPKTDGYAKSYAQAGLQLEGQFPESELAEAVRVQCLYILNNLPTWRGDVARGVRARLKELSKKPKK